MSANLKRAAVYFKPELHRALRLKVVEMDRSLSDLVNEAVQLSLVDNAEDIAAFKQRSREPNLPFGGVVEGMKRRGKI